VAEAPIPAADRAVAATMAAPAEIAVDRRAEGHIPAGRCQARLAAVATVEAGTTAAGRPAAEDPAAVTLVARPLAEEDLMEASPVAGRPAAEGLMEVPPEAAGALRQDTVVGNVSFLTSPPTSLTVRRLRKEPPVLPKRGEGGGN
jgi:hypothetical protein